MVTTPRRILVAVPDLFFSARIDATARASGTTLIVCALADLPERSRTEHPDMVIADLHAPGVFEAVRALRANLATRDLRVVGFYSHVDNETRAAALEAGVTDVMPRSAFTAKLGAILTGEA